MGERGPVPRPTAIKRVQGTRADRINDREPSAELLPDVPPAPGHLDAAGRKMWERLAPSLRARGLLTAWDLETFAITCDLYSQLLKAARALEIGVLARGRRDGLITNPAWRVYRDCAALFRAYAHEFGLTPSARSRFVMEVDLPGERLRLEVEALEDAEPA